MTSLQSREAEQVEGATLSQTAFVPVGLTEVAAQPLVAEREAMTPRSQPELLGVQAAVLDTPVSDDTALLKDHITRLEADALQLAAAAEGAALRENDLEAELAVLRDEMTSLQSRKSELLEVESATFSQAASTTVHLADLWASLRLRHSLLLPSVRR
eukprot:TRINITY_DN298_c0_g1_i4.p1 TRINITY_DN298_c0_g1~~TRINITY_DN298_c0_g1_i4.p1  ORF type:complete len:157 (+),score=11.92 TRINITY_DN298_c0_g1_i4:424-894(+)